VGFERVFSAAEMQSFNEILERDGWVLSVDGTAGGFKVSRSLLEYLRKARESAVKAPPYEAWARDGKIQGVVWADTGFRSAEAKETLNEYLAYYRSQGFRFTKQPVTDFPAWIESHVKSGELDYMIREGHEQKILRMARSGELMVGRRSGDPAQEVVVFFPGSDGTRAELSWKSMSQALDSRSASDSENPLLYFDTKCFSFEGTVCELPNLVRPDQLQVVGSRKAATTFLNQETSPLRALMEGLLQKDTYARMNSRLQSARRRAGSGNEDDYVFPDSAAYQRAVIPANSRSGQLEWVPR